jgi:hypothetical protein
MTLATVQAIVGRPPDRSPPPPGKKMGVDQQTLYVESLPECDTAIWRDQDQSLVVCYSMEPDRRVLGKGFYLALDLAELDGTAGWRRLTKWFRKVYR